MLYDVIIIGSGPAGMTAAIYCVRKGLSTLVIGKEVGGQVAKSGEVENYLGYWVKTGMELVQKFHQHVERFEGLEHLHGLEIVSFRIKNKDPQIFEVVVDGGKLYQSRALIIASGRNPRKLGVPGEEEFTNKGVSYCEVCDAPLFRGKRTAVIGGGNSALEAGSSLANLSTQVYIVNIGEEPGGDEILREKVKSLANIEIINQAETKEILGDQFVKALVYLDKNTGQEKKIEIEGVFVEIGWVPAVSFDHLTEKNQRNEIIIDRKNCTSIAGVFAAGDVTNVPYNQVVVAAGEGAKAALSAYEWLARQKKLTY